MKVCVCVCACVYVCVSLVVSPAGGVRKREGVQDNNTAQHCVPHYICLTDAEGADQLRRLFAQRNGRAARKVLSVDYLSGSHGLC